MKTFVMEAMPKIFWELIEKKGFSNFFNTDSFDSQIAIIRTETIFNKDLFKKFTNLKLILRAGSGFDNIDLRFAKKNKVLVGITPNANVNSAFEHTISLIFALIKHHSKGKNEILKGSWKKEIPSNWEIKDLKVCIVGVGRIGSRVATLLKNLGAKVLGVDPYLTIQQKKNIGIDFVDYETGLRFCNLISFHPPLFEGTYHYFDSDSLKKLSNPIWLVNTSRGGIVDESILPKALVTKQLLGVALDVYEVEPPKSQKYFNKNCLYLTPHTGAYSYGAKKRMCLETLSIWEKFVFEGKFEKTIDERFGKNFK